MSTGKAVTLQRESERERATQRNFRPTRPLAGCWPALPVDRSPKHIQVCVCELYCIAPCLESRENEKSNHGVITRSIQCTAATP